MIVSLPPQNHINPLRAFLQRFRRMRAVPSNQEFQHAEEQLRALEATVRLPTHSRTGSMPTSADIINQREEEL